MARQLGVRRRLGECIAGAGAEPQSQPEILIDPNGPGADHGDSTRVPLPPAGPERDAFLKEFITVIPRPTRPSWHAGPLGPRVLPAGGAPGPGRAGGRAHPAAHLAHLRLGAGARRRRHRRRGGVRQRPEPERPGLLRHATASSTTSASTPTTRPPTIGMLYRPSVAIAAGLFTWAMLIPEMVTTPEETVKLATGYNRALAKKYGAPGARSTCSRPSPPGSAASPPG